MKPSLPVFDAQPDSDDSDTAAAATGPRDSGDGPDIETLPIGVGGMTCAGCAGAVERALDRQAGVRSAVVSLQRAEVVVRYDPHSIDRSEIESAIQATGYEVLPDTPSAAPAGDSLADRDLRRMLLGVALTIPLFLLSMGRDFGLLGPWAHQSWVNYLMLALATPVQFVVGWDFYRGAVRSLRGGSANMDVLVTMSTTVAYLYSIAVMAALATGTAALGSHVYFETSATIITLIMVGHWIERRKPPARSGRCWTCKPNRLGSVATAGNWICRSTKFRSMTKWSSGPAKKFRSTASLPAGLPRSTKAC